MTGAAPIAGCDNSAARLVRAHIADYGGPRTLQNGTPLGEGREQLMEPHITLSALEPKHLASLEPLWNALFDHHLSIGAAGLPTIPREQSWPLRQAHYARLITHSPQCSIWLAAQEEHPVGYALAYETHDSADPLWVLETLSVLPEYRGAGIGRALLTAVDEDAHTAGIRVCAVDVMGGNPRARDLYLRAGYLPHTETWVRSIPPETSHEPTTTRRSRPTPLPSFTAEPRRSGSPSALTHSRMTPGTSPTPPSS